MLHISAFPAFSSIYSLLRTNKMLSSSQSWPPSYHIHPFCCLETYPSLFTHMCTHMRTTLHMLIIFTLPVLKQVHQLVSILIEKKDPR